MKTKGILAVLVGCGLVHGGGPMAGTSNASDITALVGFTGTVYNRPARQAIRGGFRGTGEFGILKQDATFFGIVQSQPGTRLPERNVYGKYPVNVELSVRRSGVGASDSFGTNVEVRRRAILISRVGKIRLARALKPKKPGRQKVRGSGLLRYDF